MATPSGLANLAAGLKPTTQAAETQEQGATLTASRPEQPNNVAPRTNPEPFSNCPLQLRQPSKFSITVVSDDGKTLRFILTRDGLSWKLTNILLPQDWEKA
jgi:hypothetical protein